MTTSTKVTVSTTSPVQAPLTPTPTVGNDDEQ
jgi:hypothetical protein